MKLKEVQGTDNRENNGEHEPRASPRKWPLERHDENPKHVLLHFFHCPAILAKLAKTSVGGDYSRM